MKKFLFFVNLFVFLFISLFYTSSVEAQVTCSGGTYVCRWFSGMVNLPPGCQPGWDCTSSEPAFDYSSALPCTVTGPTGPQCVDMQFTCGTNFGGELYSESCQYSDPGGGGGGGGGGPGPTSPPADPCGGLPRSYCNGGNSSWYCCGSGLYCDPENPSSGSFTCSSTPPATACPGNPGDGTLNACRSSCLSGETVYGSPTNNACGAGQVCCNSAPSACPGLPPGGINTCRSSCTGNEVIYGSPTNNACGAGQLCCFSETTDCPGLPSSGGTNACLNGSSCPGGTIPYGSLTNNACGAGRVCCNTPPASATACPNNPPEGGTNTCLNGSSCPGGTTTYGNPSNNACGAGRVCCNTPAATNTPVPGCKNIGLSCGGSNGTCCSPNTCSNGICTAPVTNTPVPPSCGSGGISCTGNGNCPGTQVCTNGCCTTQTGPTDVPGLNCGFGETVCGSVCCGTGFGAICDNGVCTVPPPPGTVDILGQHRRADGTTLAPPPSNTSMTVVGTRPYTSASNPFQFNNLNPGTYTITAAQITGYDTSYRCDGSMTNPNCGAMGSSTWYTGNSLSYNLPNGGNRLSILFRYSPQKTPPTPCLVSGAGDVNGDGFVTAVDSTLVFDYILGSITLTPAQIARGDVVVTQTPGLTITDVTAINAYIAGSITTFPACTASPTCTSLAMQVRSNVISGTTVDVQPGATVRLLANISNDNGNHDNSVWGASGGTYTDRQWDYSDWVAPNTPGDYDITYALNGVNQTSCAATLSVSAPACTGTTGSQTVTGTIRVDINGNNCSDNGGVYSDTAPTFTLRAGSLERATTTYNLGTNLYSLTDSLACSNVQKSVTLSGLPSEYRVANQRLNGVWTGQVGYSGNLPSNSNNPVTLDFCVSTASSWYQTDTGDVRYSSLTNRVPAGAQGSNSPTAPGIFFSSDGLINQTTFGEGAVSATNWKVAEEYDYNDDFSNGLGGMSYSFYKSQARRLNRPISYLTSIGISNVGNLSTGIYEYTGSPTINATTIDAAPPNGRHIILLISGDVIINGPITVPRGRGNLFVLAAKGNITINSGVGTTTVSDSGIPPVGTTQLDGYYTSEESIIVQSSANCTSGISDRRLNVSGALIAHSLRPFANGGDGQVINNRTLCASNASYPSLFVSSRPEFLLQMTDFYKTTYKFFKEVNP